MNIMFDYDNTFTRDTRMWEEFISLATAGGHRLYCVTSRSPDMELDYAERFALWGVRIVYCSFRAKKTVCEEQGIFIDIWIDDDPLYITTGFIE